MPNTVTRANIRDELDRSMPAAFKAKLGTTIYALIDLCNKQNAVIKALVAKLNADAGVTDTDYTAASLVDVKKPEQR
jgi:hypothetical protein